MIRWAVFLELKKYIDLLPIIDTHCHKMPSHKGFPEGIKDLVEHSYLGWCHCEWDGTRAVSYTHLDVYKRQYHQYDELPVEQANGLFFIGNYDLIIPDMTIAENLYIIEKINYLQSVSYTHLIV